MAHDSECPDPVRRALLGVVLAMPIAATIAPVARAAGQPVPATAVTLRTLLDAPVLASFYAAPPGGHVGPGMLAGLNRNGFRLIEEQRIGTEWIIHGEFAHKRDWIDEGWAMLDAGVQYQHPDGSFAGQSYFHSNSLFLEGLARACIIEPQAATQPRLDALFRGCNWLIDPANEAKGKATNLPYTHRNYIMAACLGQAGAVLGIPEYGGRARRWAEAGIGRQQPDGTNPEMGGFDASYQMVGPLFALRYYPYADSSEQIRLRIMLRAALRREAQVVTETGDIDEGGSTRIGHEMFGDTMKRANIPEIVQAFGWMSVIDSDPLWAIMAQRIGKRHQVL